MATWTDEDDTSLEQTLKTAVEGKNWEEVVKCLDCSALGTERTAEVLATSQLTRHFDKSPTATAQPTRHTGTSQVSAAAQPTRHTDKSVCLVSWAVTETCKYCTDVELVSKVLTHCRAVDVRSALNTVSERSLWACVAYLLSHRAGCITSTDRQKVFRKAGQHASQWSLEHWLLPHCGPDCVNIVLGLALKRHLWDAVAALLKRDLSSPRMRVKVAAEAISEFDDTLDPYLKRQVYGSDASTIVSEDKVSEYYPLSAILPLCAEGQFEEVYKMAVKKRSRPAVVVLLNATVGETQKDWAVRKASKALSEELIIKYVLPFCPDKSLSRMLQILVERGLWRAMGELLSKDLTESERWWGVEQALKKAGELSLTGDILRHCPESKLTPALELLVKRGIWNALKGFLNRNFSETTRGWAVVEACKRASSTVLTEYILHHCPVATMESAFTILIRRGLWTAVTHFLHRSDDKERWAWVVETAFDHAPACELQAMAERDCPYGSVSKCLEAALRRKKWGAVSVLVNRENVSQPQREKVVMEACKAVSGNHIDSYYLFRIIDYCPENMIDSVLRVLIHQGMFWDSVGTLLDVDILTFSQQMMVFEEALKDRPGRCRSYPFHIIWGYKNRPQRLDRFVVELIKRGEWGFLEKILVKRCGGSAFFHLDKCEDSKNWTGPRTVGTGSCVSMSQCQPSSAPRSFTRHRFVVQYLQRDELNRLHVFCSSGLWRSMPYIADRGVNPLAVDDTGRSLLNLAVLNDSHPEELLLACVKLGVGHYQPEITRQALKSLLSSDLRYSGVLPVHLPFRCALNRHSIVMLRILYESGACESWEIERELRDLEERCFFKNVAQRLQDVTQFLQELSSVPRSLKSSCRLVVSLCLGAGGHYREDRVRQLPLPDNIKSYLLFTDLEQLVTQNDVKPLSVTGSRDWMFALNN